MGKNKEEHDAVNRPSHYTYGNIEVIDMIESAGWLPQFCAGNALKYLMRHEHKVAPIEDLKKAQWYLNKLIEYKEKEAIKANVDGNGGNITGGNIKWNFSPEDMTLPYNPSNGPVQTQLCSNLDRQFDMSQLSDQLRKNVMTGLLKTEVTH